MGAVRHRGLKRAEGVERTWQTKQTEGCATSQVQVPMPWKLLNGSAQWMVTMRTAPHISNTANNLFLYVTYRFFSLAYQTLITIFGSPTFIYSRHGFYKYVLFSFFHLFLRKSVGKGTEKYFPLTLMQHPRYPACAHSTTVRQTI